MRGLVLEGGGGNGAFQFGALLALAEAGIKFDYVSGTSVGALNAALWATGALAEGRDLWSGLRTSRLFRVRLWLLPIMLILIPARLFRTHARGLVPDATPLPRVLRLLFALICAGPGLAECGVVVFLFFDIAQKLPNPIAIAWISLPIAVTIFYTLWYSLSDGGRRPWREESLPYSVTIFLLTIVLLFAAVSHHYEPWMGLLAAVVLPGPILFALGASADTLNIAVLDPAPLRRILDIVTRRPLIAQLFITMARHETFFDPDNLEYTPIVLERGRVDRYDPVQRHEVVPVYLRCDSETPRDELVQALLDSSAIPLGIISRTTTTKDSRFIDGGVADNLPWYPCVGAELCDELTIVCCSPHDEWSDGPMRSEWTSRRRRLAVVRGAFQFKSVNPKDVKERPGVRNVPPSVVPLELPASWPQRVVVISPERPLGGLVTGTLNFSARRARKLIRMGQVAARRSISA